MRLLVYVLLRICKFAAEFPRLVIAVFLTISVAGFSTLPFLKISTDLISGVGETNKVITLAKENSEIFGEEDALILVLAFSRAPRRGPSPIHKRPGRDH